MGKRLYKLNQGRMLDGVCGGIAKYFGLDPTLVRLVWLLCSLSSCGTGLIIYVVASLLIPEENDIVG